MEYPKDSKEVAHVFVSLDLQDLTVDLEFGKHAQVAQMASLA